MREVWNSKHWANGKARSLKHSDRDKADPTGWSEAVGPSDTRLALLGDGILELSGRQPRLYIQSWERHGVQFRDVEVEVYFRRVKDDNTPWGGLTIGARSGSKAHGNPSGRDCDAHTYYMRFKNDGSIDFDKELAHPHHTSKAIKKRVFGSKLPLNKWIGGKFRIFNISNSLIKLEAYADFGDGRGWVLVNETEDDGNWRAKGASKCKRWPTERELYLGGGLVFIRNTDVEAAQYKDMVVRDLAAEPEPIEDGEEEPEEEPDEPDEPDTPDDDNEDAGALREDLQRLRERVARVEAENNQLRDEREGLMKFVTELRNFLEERLS